MTIFLHPFTLIRRPYTNTAHTHTNHNEQTYTYTNHDGQTYTHTTYTFIRTSRVITTRILVHVNSLTIPPHSNYSRLLTPGSPTSLQFARTSSPFHLTITTVVCQLLDHLNVYSSRESSCHYTTVELWHLALLHVYSPRECSYDSSSFQLL